MKVRQLRKKHKVFADLAMYRTCQSIQLANRILNTNPLNGSARASYKYHRKQLVNIRKRCSPDAKRFANAFLRLYG